nr:Site-specific recombinase XerD [uncultured bacterium]
MTPFFLHIWHAILPPCKHIKRNQAPRTDMKRKVLFERESKPSPLVC